MRLALNEYAPAPGRVTAYSPRAFVSACLVSAGLNESPVLATLTTTPGTLAPLTRSVITPRTTCARTSGVLKANATTAVVQRTRDLRDGSSMNNVLVVRAGLQSP